MPVASPVRLWTIAFASGLAAGMLGILFWGSVERGDAAQSASEGASQGRSAMSRLLGAEPERCVFSGPGREICSWRVEGRLFQADPAGASPTPHSIAVICEIPLSDADGSPSCRSHVAELSQVDGDAGDLPPVGAGGVRPSPRSETLPEVSALAEAQTLVELSHLAGDVPERCVTGVGRQTCTWRLQPGSDGHARVASGRDGVVWLRCRLPLDGSARVPGSCTASTLALELGAS